MTENTSATHYNDPGNANSEEIRSNPDHSKPQNRVISTAGGGGEKPAASPTTGPGTSGNTLPQKTVLQKKYKLEFAVEPGCMKKLEEAKAILSKKYPKGVPLGKLLEEALDAYLEKHSPERKKKRREEREAKQQGKLSHSKKAQKAKANKSTYKPEAERCYSKEFMERKVRKTRSMRE
jgi:hypothetical protein